MGDSYISAQSSYLLWLSNLPANQTTAFPVLGKFFPHLISICFKHSPINKVHYRIIRNINIKFIQIVELLLFLNTFSF